MGTSYRYAKIPQCGYEEHVVKHIAFYVQNYIMVRWIFTPATMHFRPRYDTFWPCGLFTLLQFCKKKNLQNQYEKPDEKLNYGDIFKEGFDNFIITYST